MNERITLVIPTIRENCFKDFVKRWQDVGLFEHIDRFIVMEDNPKRTFGVERPTGHAPGAMVDHYSWEDIRQELGDKEWIIPRRSDTVRSFAYYMAWAGYGGGPDGSNRILPDYILTLDDDCYPCTAANDGLDYNGLGFLRGHVDYMEKTRWFNTLNSVKPRGIPFYNLGKTENRIIVNHGLWTNVLDYDAPFQLANPIKEEFSFDNHIVPAGLYFPMCGMNVMWRREATPLMYHLLMGQRKVMLPSVDGAKEGLLKLPFDRFGDIWCGIFMKKIADMMGCLVTTGMPYIRHERASNPFTNLKKEANGIEVNEDLWQHVDSFVMFDDDKPEFAYLYGELGKHIAGFIEKYPKYKEHDEYFHLLGKAMVQWAELFKGE